MIRSINKITLELIHNLPVAIFAKDPKDNFRIFLWNRKAEEVFGRSSEEMVGKTDFDIFEPDHATFFRQKDIETFANRSPIEIPLEGVTHSTRGTLWLRTRKVPLFDEKGEPWVLLGVSEDITQEHVTVTKLSESEAKFAELAKNIPGMLYKFAMHPNGQAEFLYVSAASKALYGLEPEECVGPENSNQILGQIHPDDVQQFTQSVLDSAKTLSPWQWTGRSISRTGRETWVNAASTPQLQENGDVIWDGVLLDVTAQKHAEGLVKEQRLQLQLATKLSALGQLAASISHEINNPVASIKLLSEEISDIVEDTSVDRAEVKTIATKISASAVRIAKIIGGLRSFVTRKHSEPLAKTDCANLIKEIVDIAMPRAVSESVEMDVKILSSDLQAECRPVEVSQVIMNLISNALDAVKGTPNPWVKLTAEKTEDSILVRVQDSGAGVPAENKEKIFNPFFTTKAEGIGTGLGLNISAELMRNHGGLLSLESNHPTTFLMRLPVVAVVPTAAP